MSFILLFQAQWQIFPAQQQLISALFSNFIFRLYSDMHTICIKVVKCVEMSTAVSKRAPQGLC